MNIGNIENHFLWEPLNYWLDNYKIWEENYDLIIIFFLKWRSKTRKYIIKFQEIRNKKSKI